MIQSATADSFLYASIRLRNTIVMTNGMAFIPDREMTRERVFLCLGGAIEYLDAVSKQGGHHKRWIYSNMPLPMRKWFEPARLETARPIEYWRASVAGWRRIFCMTGATGTMGMNILREGVRP